MRVLLTGATGFVGSAVLRRLLADNRHEVAILVRSSSDTRRISDLLHQSHQIHGTLENLADAEPAIRAFAPEAVAHLAWSGVGGKLRDDPVQLANLASGLKLVQLAARVGASHWIGLGSQAEHGPIGGALAEDAPIQPSNLYGATKGALCLVGNRLSATLGLRFSWLRLFSAYGPGDDAALMIPYLTLRLLAGERPALTAGEQLWDYLYIDDAAEAIAQVLESPTASGIYNLGSGTAIPLRAVIEKIRDLVNPAGKLGFGEVAYSPHQIMHLEADVSRLREHLCWTPRVPLDEGLTRTVQWYRDHRDN